MTDSFDRAQRAYDAQEPHYAKPCPECEAHDAKLAVSEAFETLLELANPTDAGFLIANHVEAFKALAEELAESASEWRLSKDYEYCDKHRPTKDDEE